MLRIVVHISVLFALAFWGWRLWHGEVLPQWHTAGLLVVLAGYVVEQVWWSLNDAVSARR